MDIPVIPLRMKRNMMMSSDIVFDRSLMTMTEDAVSYEEIIRHLETVCGKDTPLLIADVKGMQKKDIVPDILKRMKIKRELWLMTGIRNSEDVMDAFNGDISKAVVPYHFTSDALLREMTELSDSCIPALFTDNGVVLGNTRTAGKGTAHGQTGSMKNGLRDVVRTLEGMNFRKVLVFDVTGNGSAEDAGDPVRIWENISGLSDIVIPYVPSGTKEDVGAVRGLGFSDVTTPAVRLVRNEL